MKNTMKRVLAAAALLSIAAVPNHLRAQSQDSEPAVYPKSVTVQVENDNWLDMRVYAVRENGASDRIGTVTSFSTRKFEISYWLAAGNSEIQLIAVPIGSTERYASPPVVVSKGDVIEWRLANNLALSSIFVRAS